MPWLNFIEVFVNVYLDLQKLLLLKLPGFSRSCCSLFCLPGSVLVLWILSQPGVYTAAR